MNRGPRREKFERPAKRERFEKRDRHERRDRPDSREQRERTPEPVVERAADGRYIWGVNPVLEALRANPERVDRLLMQDGGLSPKVAAEVFTRARDARIRIDKVERDRLAALTAGGTHQGLAAMMRQYDYVELEALIKRAKGSGQPPLVVVLDGIQDPHNLGAIIRSAHAFGAHGVVIAKDRAVGVTGVVAKASAGAVEHCPVARVVNISRALEALREAGLWSVAADPGGEQTVWAQNLTGPLAAVVGAEGAGVRDGVLKQCDFRVRIPMAGQVASLNASVSTGVLLAEIARRRLLG